MSTRLRELYNNDSREANLLLVILTAFLLIYFMPAGTARFDNAILEAFRLTHLPVSFTAIGGDSISQFQIFKRK